MDLYKAIRELHEERKRLDQVITSLEEFQKRADEQLAEIGVKKRRGRKSMDAEAREEVSQRMKEYWAARKRGAT
jgi:hypothetical protein